MQHVRYASADGTTVRMFVLAKRGRTDQPRATILTGYGGFNVSRTPTYTPSAIAWVEAGGVHAAATVLIDEGWSTRFWSHEYGSADDPTELDWLLSYSPYHHVVAGTAYPATMFTVFEGDTRVDLLHARKMCAALQAATSEPLAQRPILFRLEVGVGHGARAASRTAGLTADQLAFFARYLDLSR